jgi:two-component system chemotaxis response regulator CheB
LVIGMGRRRAGSRHCARCSVGCPPTSDAAVCVVLHLPAGGKSLLAPILDRATPLDAAVALDGEPLEAGRVYVAPADRHLLVEEGRISLSDGPKENGTRPAVDPMLRTLAGQLRDRAPSR